MILVIAEKPSVAQTIAAALGAKKKQDGYIEGNGYLIHGASGIWYSLPTLPPMGSSTKSGAMTACRFCRRNGSIPFPQIRESNSKS